MFGQLIKRKVDRGHQFLSIIEVLDSCDKDVFPNMNCLLHILISLVNRIKSTSRATMLTERLNSMSLLMFEKELAEKLDSDEIINAFKAKPRRLALYIESCAVHTGKQQYRCVLYFAAKPNSCVQMVK